MAELPLYALWAPEVGLLALALAGSAGVLAASTPWLGRFAGRVNLLAPLIRIQLTGCILAFVCLQVSLLNDDFSVAYVQANSHAALPLGYKIAALWGAHEGSLLLWVLLLAFWAQLTPATRTALPAPVVIAAINAAFIFFTLLTSNPFARLLPLAPETGADLNPLLQHPALAIHPPLLYAGYTGMSVSFALLCSGLVGGDFSRDRILDMYRRMLVPLALLTAGIALGSWWAYQELGWGGWWFWDPVENLSILPWLAATALVHVLRSTLASGQQRRDFIWCALIAAACFPLAVLGAFMVRSGLLISVHSFSTDPSRGLFLLVLLALITTPVVLLLPRLVAPQAQPRPLSSREALLLISATLLLVAAGVVLLGTLWPLLHELVTGDRAVIGAPYFERVLAPMALVGLIFMATAPWTGWRRTLQIPRPLLLLAAGCALIGLVLPSAVAGRLLLWEGLVGALVMLGMALLLGALWTGKVRSWRMLLGHLGVFLAVAGAMLQAGFGEQQEVLIRPGERLETSVGTLFFTGIDQVQAANYRADVAHFRLQRPGGRELWLHPEKRFYAPRQVILTEAAIERVGVGDLYLALGRTGDDGSWSLRVHYKPFIGLLWAGVALLTLAMLLTPMRSLAQFAVVRRAAGSHE